MALIDFSLNDVGKVFKDIREAITGEAVKDPQKIAELANKLQELENDANRMQTEVNKVEAQHSSIWVAGWRPAIGWVAALSLLLMYVPKAIVMTFIWTWQCVEVIDAAEKVAEVALPIFPELGTGDIIGLVASMLGVGIMRSVDKYNKTDTKRFG